jgi:phosphate transport system substrate-binding protein
MKNVSLNNMLRSILVFTTAALFLSCSSEKRETLTSGRLTMVTSEDLYPVVDLQVLAFQRMYEEVKIVNRSASTREAMVQLLNDSIKLIVSARSLNAEERAVALKNEFEIDSTTIAYDGIAVVVNEKNGLTQLSTAELKAILTGSAERWSSFKESSLSSAIVIAVGDPNSAVHEYVRSTIAGTDSLSRNVLPCPSTPDVFAVVKDRPNAIGFVSSAWLSSMPKNVRSLRIGDPAFRRDSTSTVMEYFLPHQAYIYQRLYPLSRTIRLFTHNVGKGVGLGFISFAASSDGQKIIVSNGLVPATMPVRLVQLQTP